MIIVGFDDVHTNLVKLNEYNYSYNLVVEMIFGCASKGSEKETSFQENCSKSCGDSQQIKAEDVCKLYTYN